jgi:NAD-dependent deacetylase
MIKPTIVVLTGAGISAESGIQTFRDTDGLWEKHDIMEVASLEGWEKNPDLVLEFYNKRRSQLLTCKPNEAHKALAAMESWANVQIITQNVDDLHERGGSTNVLHLHGELLKVHSTKNPEYIKAWRKKLKKGDLCPEGGQLRPHIVWFGEIVEALDKSIPVIENADALMIIGTSMQVYPAAGLVAFAPDNIPVFYIDPKPNINYELRQTARLIVFSESATTGTPKACEELKNLLQPTQKMV